VQETVHVLRLAYCPISNVCKQRVWMGLWSLTTDNMLSLQPNVIKFVPQNDDNPTWTKALTKIIRHTWFN